MPRKSESEAISKHTLNLYAGDYRKLQEMYPETGAAIIIRKIIRMQIVKIEAGLSAEDEKALEQEFNTI